MQVSIFSRLPVAVAVLSLVAASSVFAQGAGIVAPPAQISGIVPPPLPPAAAIQKKAPAADLSLPAAPVSSPAATAKEAIPAAASQGAAAQASVDAANALVLPPMPPMPAQSIKENVMAKAVDPAICAPAPVKKPDPTKPPSQKLSDKSQKKKEDLVKPEKIEGKQDAALSPFHGLAQTQVSDTQLNQFVFPEPVEGLYFPEGSPLPECPKDAKAQDPCKPVFLNGRQLLLLPLRVGAKGPVQMLVHLNSGRMVTFNLAPTQGPGTVVRVEGADYAASDARARKAAQSEAASPSSADIALLEEFVNGKPSSGFESVAPNTATKLDRIDVIPMAAWSDGAKLKVHLWKLQARDGVAVALSAALFQAEGVKAIALDKEQTTKASPAFVYVLEQIR